MIIPIDAHHHISNNPLKDSIFNTYNMEGIKNLNRGSSYYINLGIHPLYINEDFDMEYIQNILKENSCINIGEVGLDKRGDKNKQLEVLKQFVTVAKQFNRSISFHCVKSWGGIIENIKELDSPLLFHGFNGSREVLNTLLKSNSYFSFSLRELRIPRIREVCTHIPIDRQLIESDMIQEEYDEIDHQKYINILESCLKELSLINSMPPEDFNYIIDASFRKFTNWRE